MPLFLLDHDLRAGDVAREPLSVMPGYEHVGQAVDDPSWHADLGKLEAPWLEEAKVVINPTPDPTTKCLARRLPDDVVTLLKSLVTKID